MQQATQTPDWNPVDVTVAPQLRAPAEPRLGGIPSKTA